MTNARTIATLAVLVPAILLNCSSPPQEPVGPAHRTAEMAAGSMPPQESAGGDWTELIRRLKQQQEVSAQEKQAQADEHYRLAERYFQAGDYEKARLECENAIQLDPNHAAAGALLLQVNFIMGRGKQTPVSEDTEKYMREARVRQQQLFIEIDNSYNRGIRHYNAGEYEAAEREFRMILEYAKWVETGVELETRRKQSLEMLQKTRQASKQKKIDEDKLRNQMIEREKEREDLARILEEKRELELLFGMAQQQFERQEFEACLLTCDKILYINPNVASVAEMKQVAQRLRHEKTSADSLKGYIEEWKRTFEKVEINSIVQAAILEFPDRETWEEVVGRRRAKELTPLEEQVSPEDQEILGKLKSRIGIDMQNQPLTAIVDFLRDISGLNFVIDGRPDAIERPEEILISFTARDVPIEGVLKLMFEGKGLAYTVEDRVVTITKTDLLKKKVKLELYDVQDLTFGLQHFPGVEISLQSEGIGTALAAEEGAKQQFTGDDLANLIKSSIEKNNWDEAAGQSVKFQNGLLIVRNNTDVHKKIRKFLSDLRASTGILVSVETRFLSVSDDFLQEVGMDFRDVNGARVVGLTNLSDINPAFVVNPQFVSPGAGLSATSAGVTGLFGNKVSRPFGARVQNIMTRDFLLNRFFLQSLGPLGGGTLQYTLLDDISLEMIMRLVSKSERGTVLTAPKLTCFNTQRANIRISNQFAYIKDYDIQIATAAVAPDPIPDVVSDGITLDVTPIVSADRRFVTIDLRPTVATLFPPPPQIFRLQLNLGIQGNPVTTTQPLQIETPILNIQRLRSTVVIPDRGTLLIGGLSSYFDEDAESSIPIWRNIPILGNLGSAKIKGRQRKQLLIILSARIIIPAEEENRLFSTQ